MDMKSATIRSAVLNNSVYYDFDTVYVDYPEAENKALRNPSLADNYNSKKGPGDKNLVLEGSVKDSGCCSKSDTCNMF